MTGIIILAAGTSSRLGRAKQTLAYKGQSLLMRSLQAAVNARIGPVVVVIGANKQEILVEIKNEPVTIAINNEFAEGMSSSIKTGINCLLAQDKRFKEAILMVCDQPFVDDQLLRRLRQTKIDSHQPIVACSYKNTIGVPALFDKLFFTELLSLKGDEGGKKVLVNNPESVATIPFPDGFFDIDTDADYNKLIG